MSVIESNLSSPIKSVAELENLTLNSSSCSSVPLQSFTLPRSRQVLLCHDMAGGYQEDAKIGGSTGNNVYNLQYLHYIDVFVYFSHERITVPPRQWVEATHKQGVKCLGTFIVEWEQGEEEILKLIYGPDYCKVLESTQTDYSHYYADRLVDIAHFYKFDGYLFNVECRLPSATHCIVLKRFLDYLTRRLHQVLPGSLLIWYDSVIYNGDLSWQDQLNEKNEMFFDVCDGIFTNYTWNEMRLQKSAENASAKGKRHAVFTGVDIWGRNTFGGGGFNTHKALRAIQKADTSVALFAPAWTFEHLGSDNFEENERRFWIETSFLNPKFKIDEDDIGCASDFLERRRVCSSFETNFCKGLGSMLFSEGVLISNTSWNNLAIQNLQPTLTESFSFESCNVLVVSCSTDAFSGGQCYVNSSQQSSRGIGSYLFETSFDRGRRLNFEIVFKYSNPASRVGIAIEDEDKNQNFIYLEQNDIEELNCGWSKGLISFSADVKIVKIGVVIDTYKPHIPFKIGLLKLTVE